MSRYTQGYIPPNLGKISFMDGRIQIRNAAETIIVFCSAFLLNAILSKFVPPMISFMTCALLGIALAIPALFGVGGEPFSIFILNIINYSNTRTYVTLRPPQRDVEGVSISKPKKESRLDEAVNSLFIGGSPAEKKSKPAKKTKEERRAEKLEAQKRKIDEKQQAQLARQQSKAEARHEKQRMKTEAKYAKKRAKQEKRYGR